MKKVDGSLNWSHVFSELVIVIAGILIAIGIDGYFQHLNNTQTAGKYLQGISNDLKADLRSLDSLAQMKQKKIDALQLIIDTLALNNAAELDLEKLADDHLFYMGSEFLFLAQKSTLQALGETGNFQLFEDIDLLQGLLNYQRYTEYVEVTDKGDNTFIREIIENYVYDHIPLRRLRPFRFIYPNRERVVSKDVWIKLFTDAEFENLILSSIFRSKLQLSRYQTAMSKATALRKQIEVYLD